ncbi:hypothetical protein LTR91_015565 [Friedmanniomyces endolithicus]|uniref:Anaphase-promoting complex subunit 4 WD40 domain-containing protein n=1 Tax=Friedmanniomyces endolithicus TaxID=329885 RepID=A0AAN6K9R3_9PEZI|nr:hypothetical protein LTR94_012906 [Friedmanniomyces endolithicus]KAK0780612.1 hypothetical protein LTR75_014965 [Friedmanniomyces endolithicus]KAK0783098.1 hypothetical protein LTR59_011890 [Friedmanniomyces endolithicus]KAK0811107.1 hypothetical protein LTR38_003712 [Friedmanniomyces endolithicus]KAK0857104.1 hypothetical protein LTR03_001025 [Friedmanniomyces endolithicus]
MPSITSPSGHFPTLCSCTKLVDGQALYDVKFYPYPTTDDEPIFAVTGSSHLFICRPKLDADPPFEVLRWFQLESGEHSFNSLAWARDPVSGEPLICVAGEKPKQIQIFNVESGKHVRSLVGHGAAINDLAISPISSSLLASASADYTIRLWNLDPAYKDQPCVAIFAGEGHRQHVLTAQFHPNGKWIVTAGLDTAIAVWAVPSIDALAQHRAHRDGSHPAPLTVYYPHFHSTEVHANYIDTAVFYGDLILSRSAKGQSEDLARTTTKVKIVPNEILLWKIDGFDSDDDPPTGPPIPTPSVWTRSSFPHDPRSRGFQRLMTFDLPNTSRFYLRFGLLHEPGVRPILAMGNEESRFLFWDLQKLEEGYDPNEESGANLKAPGVKAPRQRKKGKAAEARQQVNEGNLGRLGELRRGEIVGGGAGSDVGYGRTPDPSLTTPTTSASNVPPERKFDLGDSFMPLKPHHSVLASTTLSPKKHFAMAQIAWSPDGGRWMVGVGDYGMMCVFYRSVEREAGRE